MDMPVYCARGRAAHLAAWLVTAPGKQEVVCADHLEASRAWAGPRAHIQPVQQPPGCGPPERPQQPVLF